MKLDEVVDFKAAVEFVHEKQPNVTSAYMIAYQKCTQDDIDSLTESLNGLHFYIEVLSVGTLEDPRRFHARLILFAPNGSAVKSVGGITTSPILAKQTGFVEAVKYAWREKS